MPTESMRHAAPEELRHLVANPDVPAPAARSARDELARRTGDLFDPPIARRTDPDTSKRAAVSYTESGKRERDQDRLYTLMQRHPGLTRGEYADLLKAGGMDWYRAAWLPNRRMNDLVQAGRARAGNPRVCCKTGARAMTYYPVITA